MSRPHLHQRREVAFALVLISALMIVCLGEVLQVLAWELRPLLHDRFGWTGVQMLPRPTRWFIESFGYRPETNVMTVATWFVWPFVAALLHCHFRYPEPGDFAHAFLFWFVSCWLLVGFAVCVVLAICAMSFFILLAEIRAGPPPAFVSFIEPISWVLPSLVVLFAGWQWYRAWAAHRHRT